MPDPQQKQTLEQFGQSIKEKYPQYADIPDAELGSKMLAKYPQYSDMVDASSSRPQGILDKVRSAYHRDTDPLPENGTNFRTFQNANRAFDRNIIQTALHPIDNLVIAPLAAASRVSSDFAHLAQASPEELAAEREKNTANWREQLANNAGGLAAGAVIGKAAADIVPRVAGEVNLPPAAKKVLSNVQERIGGYNSPVIDPKLQQASKVATAIRPASIGPDFEQSLANNLPKIKAYAQATGNPLHSQWEYAQAAKGLAQEGLKHFNENFLDPYKDDVVSMRTNPNYKGKMSGEGNTTTIGDINQRISDINDLIRGATKTAKTSGAKMSAQEKLGLDKEAAGLRNTLYNELAKRTGVTPEEIKALREGYGQQFEIADTIDAARRMRNGIIGAGNEGTSLPLSDSKMGMLEKAWTKFQGGKQYIADANLRREAGQVQPEPYNYPIPKGKGVWIDRGAERLKAAGVDAAKIEELKATPEGQKIIFESGNIPIVSRRMAAIVRQLQ
jgi:hypothetical protein